MGNFKYPKNEITHSPKYKIQNTIKRAVALARHLNVRSQVRCWCRCPECQHLINIKRVHGEAEAGAPRAGFSVHFSH